MIGRDRFYWDKLKLYYKDELQVELIPHENYENMYYLRFRWRDEKTPEFFNLINARENSRIYSARHVNEGVTEACTASLVRLNGKDDTR